MMRTKNRSSRGRRVRSLLLAVPVIGLTGYAIYQSVKKRSAAAPDRRDDFWPALGQSFATTPAEPEQVQRYHEMGPLSTQISASTATVSSLTPRFGHLIGRNIVDLGGSTVGEVEGVYYRTLSGDPEWLATNVGLVNPQRVLVPLEGVPLDDESIRVAYSKDMIESSPAVEDQVLDEETEMALYQHYSARRTLPGVEAERDSENLRLRMWVDDQPVTVQED